MQTIDFIVLLILFVSAIISFIRGFVREVLSLIAWALAVWVAVKFSAQGAVFLESYLVSPTLRVGAAFIVLFLLTLFLTSMVNFLIGHLVKSTGLSGTDRLVGLIFGLARGGIIISIGVLLGGVFGFTHEAWWKESTLLGHFEHMAFWLKDQLPPDVASNITYD